MTKIPNTPDVEPVLRPHLVCDGAAAAIDFYVAAFGAREMLRLPGPDGRLWHAAVNIGGAIVMLTDENPTMGANGPRTLGGTSVTLNLQVADAKVAAAQAIAAGATEVVPVQAMFWGDMYGIVEDPFGHRWAMVTPVGPPMDAEELREAAAKMMSEHAA